MVGFASRVTFNTPLALLIRFGSIKLVEARDSANESIFNRGEDAIESAVPLNKSLRVNFTLNTLTLACEYPEKSRSQQAGIGHCA